MPPGAFRLSKARASKILNSYKASRGTISISIEIGSTPGKRRGDEGDRQIGVAAVGAELGDADDAETGDREDRQRQLEDDSAGEHGHREEAVVVAGSNLDVELAVVEVEQELDRGRHDDEVGEGDAGQEEQRAPSA